MTRDLVTVEVRVTGALLRQHRESAGWSLQDAAAVLGCDPSKVSRVETGDRRVLPSEMLALLAAYGVPHQEREAIAGLAQSARGGWWGEYRGLLPDAMVDQALLESLSGDVMAYDPQAIPAFLQTSHYAAAIAGADPALLTAEERRLAALLTARRAAGLHGPSGAKFTVVLGEAALRQQVCGDEAMLGQLRQVAGEDGELPRAVTLRVVPFNAGAHPGIGIGPLAVMRFRGVAGAGAVCRGQHDASASVVRQAELTAAVRVFEAVRDAALSPDKSRRLIRDVVANWR